MFLPVHHSYMVKRVRFITYQYLFVWVCLFVFCIIPVKFYHIIYHISSLKIWYLIRTLFLFMYLDAHQNNWSWTALYMNSHNVCSVPHILPFIIWCTWYNWKNVVVSYGVYLCPREYSFLIWRMRDIYNYTYHKQLHRIFCRFHPEVIILDHCSSCIKVSSSNDIMFIIVI